MGKCHLTVGQWAADQDDADAQEDPETADNM